MLATKDSQITLLKAKIRELNEAQGKKERELAEMKKTIKYTKIQEYEAELAANVQESVRLQQMLEIEMRKPKLDPAMLQQFHAKQANAR